jgi:hypothetical protein
MADIYTLRDQIRMHCKDCLDPVIDDAWVHITRDFLRRTRWLRETLAIDVLDQDVQQYTLTPTDTTNLVAFGIIAATLEGEPINSGIAEQTRPGTENYYLFLPPNIIQLTWNPGAAIEDGLLVRAAINLKQTATAIPDSVLGRWDEVLRNGVLGHLLSMENSPWYSAERFPYYTKLYAGAVDAASYEAVMQAKAYENSSRKEAEK